MPDTVTIRIPIHILLCLFDLAAYGAEKLAKAHEDDGPPITSDVKHYLPEEISNALDTADAVMDEIIDYDPDPECQTRPEIEKIYQEHKRNGCNIPHCFCQNEPRAYAAYVVEFDEVPIAAEAT